MHVLLSYGQECCSITGTPHANTSKKYHTAHYVCIDRVVVSQGSQTTSIDYILYSCIAQYSYPVYSWTKRAFQRGYIMCDLYIIPAYLIFSFHLPCLRRHTAPAAAGSMSRCKLVTWAMLHRTATGTRQPMAHAGLLDGWLRGLQYLTVNSVTFHGKART